MASRDRDRGRRWRLLLLAALCGAALAGVGCRSRTQRQATAVVARAGTVELTGADLEYALAASTRGKRGLPTEAAVRALVERVLLEEALAREARETVPGAGVRADFAGREAAVRLLIDSVRKPAGDPESYYRATQSEYTRPAQVHLAEIVLATCDQARALKETLARGKLSFAAAALRDSRDRVSGARGGDLGWVPVPTLARPVARAVEGLEEGAVTVPVVSAATPAVTPVGGGATPPGCRLFQVLGRKAESRESFAAVRGRVEKQLEAHSRHAARQALLARLGMPDGGSLDVAALRAAVAPASTVPGGQVVLRAGDEQLTAAELRLALAATPVRGPGGLAAVGRRLLEGLRLYGEARRLGFTGKPAVRATVRQTLLAELARADAATVPAASLPADEVRSAYERALGDYTEPRRVRVAALVTRDRPKAERWVAALKKARFSADEFDRLAATATEDAAAAHRRGDLGWIDERATAWPEALKEAALRLPRPGAFSGVVPASGAYYVLLCRDLTPARVRPLAEVEAQIRARLERQRRVALATARRARLLKSLKVEIVPGALARFVTPTAPAKASGGGPRP